MDTHIPHSMDSKNIIWDEVKDCPVDFGPLLRRELPARGSAVRTNADQLRNSERLDGENSDVRPSFGSLSELPPSSSRSGSLIVS